MASLVLGIAGSAIGPSLFGAGFSLFGAGFSLFGASITGAEIGGAIGALAGTEIDNLIASGTHITRKSPRLLAADETQTFDLLIEEIESAGNARPTAGWRVRGQLWF